jgi:hypothetical protein
MSTVRKAQRVYVLGKLMGNGIERRRVVNKVLKDTLDRSRINYLEAYWELMKGKVDVRA